MDLTGGARFDDPLQKQAYAAYLQAAVALDGPEVRQVVEAARDLGVFVYLGTTERATGSARGTVFCTLVAIDPVTGVVGTHRKLMPTYEERLVWGTGDGHGLRVHRYGSTRVGGLNCWENWMPQARHALYAQGEELHVSVWPGNPRNTVDIARFIALEGRVFSLAANGLLSLSDVPAGFPLYQELQALDVQDYCRGGSANRGTGRSVAGGAGRGGGVAGRRGSGAEPGGAGTAELRSDRPLQPSRRVHGAGRPSSPGGGGVRGLTRAPAHSLCCCTRCCWSPGSRWQCTGCAPAGPAASSVR